MEYQRFYGANDYGIKEILKSIKNIKQRKTLEKWANERIANGCTKKGTAQQLYTFKKIGDTLNKPFEKWSKEDITRLISKDLNKFYYKRQIKHLFKWLNGGDDFPDKVRWIRLKKNIDEIPEEHKALTDEELKAIIDNTSHQRDRTIYMILAENPTRPKDICTLKIKNVVVDEYGFVLKVRSKTSSGVREIRLINSAPDFKLYWNSIPKKFKENPDHYLFYQYSSNRFGEGIGWNGLNNALQLAVKRAKIKRKVNLYDFRRTSATRLLQDPRYTTKEVQVMGGWKDPTTMLNVYGKVTSEMVNKKRLEVNGLIKSKEEKKKDILKPIECPRCKTKNPSSAIACENCWLPLKTDVVNLKKKVLDTAMQQQQPLTKDYIKSILREILVEK